MVSSEPSPQTAPLAVLSLRRVVAPGRGNNAVAHADAAGCATSGTASSRIWSSSARPCRVAVSGIDSRDVEAETVLMVRFSVPRVVCVGEQGHHAVHQAGRARLDLWRVRVIPHPPWKTNDIS